MIRNVLFYIWVFCLSVIVTASIIYVNPIGYIYFILGLFTSLIISKFKLFDRHKPNKGKKFYE
jgi:hypothetical protein